MPSALSFGGKTDVLVGAHTSTQGGIAEAPGRLAGIGGNVLQIFTRNQLQWKAAPLKVKDIKAFSKAVIQHDIRVTLSHASYLINLASSDRTKLTKSLNAFSDEIVRADQLGLDYVVFHPGAHLGKGETWGLKKIADSLNRVLSKFKTIHTMLLLETTAGQGSNLGFRFEHLAEIMDRLDTPEKFGVCLDTCHVFAGGYLISTQKGFRETVDKFDRIIGLHKLKAIHVNDSKNEFGSRKDRHENIGIGKIGRECFRTLVNEKRLAAVPLVLETPGGETFFKKNIRKLKKYRKSK